MAAAAVTRFAADLNALIAPGERIGLAVSGGPDSLALLLLAAAARPGLVAAASVDHGLRDGSRGEAEAVAAECATLGVPHTILTIDWPRVPASAVQERARAARYAALGQWAGAHGISAIATGHHADDQAETLVMRLARGAGVRGLAGMRGAAPLPGVPGIVLLRPLLGWRRVELAAVVAAAGLSPSDDPSNHDPRHERVRVRRALAGADWFDPSALAASAAHLADADAAIEYAVDAAWRAAVVAEAEIAFDPGEAPAEIRRRLAARAIAALGREGDATSLRGGELDQLLAALEAGGSATLRGVRAAGGPRWRFTPAPARR
jgi:tRNA(Ile)-lysidine synthase